MARSVTYLVTFARSILEKFFISKLQISNREFAKFQGRNMQQLYGNNNETLSIL